MSDEAPFVPLERCQSLLWSLKAEILGQPRTLFLDLGAGVSCLSPALVEAAGLRHLGSHRARRMSGAEVEFELHEGLRLGLGRAHLDLPQVAALDVGALLPPEWPPVHGVLALDAFEGRRFTLDLAADRLVLETAESFADRVRSMAALVVRPFRQIEGVTLVLLVAVDSAQQGFWFELDNSNTGPVILAPHTARAFGMLRSTEVPVDRVLDIVGLGTVTTPTLTRPILYDGNVGRTVLDGRTLAFDLTGDFDVAGDRVFVSP